MTTRDIDIMGTDRSHIAGLTSKFTSEESARSALEIKAMWTNVSRASLLRKAARGRAGALTNEADGSSSDIDIIEAPNQILAGCAGCQTLKPHRQGRVGTAAQNRWIVAMCNYRGVQAPWTPPITIKGNPVGFMTLAAMCLSRHQHWGSEMHSRGESRSGSNKICHLMRCIALCAVLWSSGSASFAIQPSSVWSGRLARTAPM